MFEPELIRLDAGPRLLFGAMVGDDMFIGEADSADGRTWACAAERTAPGAGRLLPGDGG